jgi:predicted acyltransferase
MAGFYLLLDLWGRKRWSFPLVVIGTNSIAAYCIAALGGNFIGKSLRTHLAPSVFKLFGRPYEPLLYGGFIVIVMWLLLYWIYRRKLFLRI